MQNNIRRRVLFGGVAVLAAAGGLAGAWWQRRNAEPTSSAQAMGTDFWAQRFERPDGAELALSELKGKPLLINFWATWCPPCVEELPMLDRFSIQQGANGVQVLGLAIDQPSAVRKFLARTPVQFSIGMAGLQGTELARQLGNTAGGLPFTLLLNRAGEVVQRKIGKLEPADLVAWSRAEVHG